VRLLVFKYDDKLYDTFCDTYAVVLWINVDPTPYTCIDIDNILNPDMLTNPDIYRLTPVSVLTTGSKRLHRLPYCYVYLFVHTCLKVTITY
jgi:hypothetical protein